jgi:uncharacterized cupredoxin-like copper-binding protein
VSPVKAGPGVGSGASSRCEELTPGKCSFLCTVPGDAEGGRKAELTVK